MELQYESVYRIELSKERECMHVAIAANIVTRDDAMMDVARIYSTLDDDVVNR
jgi:hypothetical protein